MNFRDHFPNLPKITNLHESPGSGSMSGVLVDEEENHLLESDGNMTESTGNMVSQLQHKIVITTHMSMMDGSS